MVIGVWVVVTEESMGMELAERVLPSLPSLSSTSVPSLNYREQMHLQWNHSFVFTQLFTNENVQMTAVLHQFHNCVSVICESHHCSIMKWSCNLWENLQSWLPSLVFCDSKLHKKRTSQAPFIIRSSTGSIVRAVITPTGSCCELMCDSMVDTELWRLTYSIPAQKNFKFKQEWKN